MGEVACVWGLNTNITAELMRPSSLSYVKVNVLAMQFYPVCMEVNEICYHKAAIIDFGATD